MRLDLSQLSTSTYLQLRKHLMQSRVVRKTSGSESGCQAVGTTCRLARHLHHLFVTITRRGHAIIPNIMRS